MADRKKVLILCTGNSCRSQMAEGFLRSYGGNRFDVVSAGTNPTKLNLLAIKVMEEKDINISHQHSKSVDEFINEIFDYVITVCDRAKETCPLFPGKAKRIHWSFEDPASAKGTEKERLFIFRKVREEIERCIMSFLKDKNSY